MIANRPVRVLHVVRPATGGMRQHIINVAKYSSPAISHSIAAPSDFLDSCAEIDCFEQRTVLEIRPTTNPLQDLQTANSLASILKAGKYGLIHCHGVRAALIASLAHVWHRTPIIATFHNLIGDSWKSRAALIQIRSGLSAGVAVSGAVAQSLQCTISNNFDLRIIPNGVSPDFMAPREHNRQTNVVGCAARLSPEKGVDVLLRASDSLPDIHFRIAGDGPMLQELLLMGGNNVEFLGPVRDMVSFYDSLSMLVVPSRQEGQGLSALEAMSRGVPVIASRVGGLKEMLRDRVDALMVDPDQPDQLVSAIHELCQDTELRRSIAQAAKKKADESYNVVTMISALEKLYGDYGVSA